MSMRAIALVVLAVLAFNAEAAKDPCLPEKPDREDRLVHQYTPFLSEQDEHRLDAKLTRFARETSNRIALLIVDSLCGYPVHDFAFEVGEAWGIGGKKDNGILIVVKPTGPPGAREVFIATGYGLEGAIPDATAKQIVENEIIPHFKQGNFYQGLDGATDVLMSLAKGEFDSKSYGKGRFPWQAVVVVVLFITLGIWRTSRKAKGYARTNNVDFWTAWWLMQQAARKHRGSWGGFTGGGGFGGGGGGGFGGFGGGSFGGGGAGGRW